MIQLYLLSVLFNILCGLVLAADYLGQKNAGFTKLSEMLSGSKSKFIIGIIAFAVGVLKLFAPVARMGGTAASWFLLGDLLPAFTGMFLGFVMLMDFLKKKAVINTTTLARLDSLVIQNKCVIGFIGIGVALVHFFFNGMVLL